MGSVCSAGEVLSAEHTLVEEGVTPADTITLAQVGEGKGGTLMDQVILLVFLAGAFSSFLSSSFLSSSFLDQVIAILANKRHRAAKAGLGVRLSKFEKQAENAADSAIHKARRYSRRYKKRIRLGGKKAKRLAKALVKRAESQTRVNNALSRKKFGIKAGLQLEGIRAMTNTQTKKKQAKRFRGKRSLAIRTTDAIEGGGVTMTDAAAARSPNMRSTFSALPNRQVCACRNGVADSLSQHCKGSGARPCYKCHVGFILQGATVATRKGPRHGQVRDCSPFSVVLLSHIVADVATGLQQGPRL